MKPPLSTVSLVGSRRAPLPPTSARLHVVHPPGLAPAFALGAPLVLGRQPEDPAVACLPHPTVSRRHLSVEWDAGRSQYAARDLGSRNGSWIDGIAAREERLPLPDGSVLRLGDVLLVCEVLRGLDPGDAPEVSRKAIPGEAALLRQLRAGVARAAPDPSPVLLLGETGSGKERIAGEIHRLSGRQGPLLAVNCATLTPQLVESQLFGHLRGAFTGAGEAQPGLFRAASGGTLFLDEIGELPLDIQPKLLRVIQEGEVQPVGSAKSIRVDVRVIAATHRDLGTAAEAGTFRRDLYARLSLWELRVPALRERRVDLLGWLDRLHRLHAQRRSRRVPPPLNFEPAAIEMLLLAEWPSNLRGLDRLVHEFAAGAANGQPITVDDLPAWIGERALPVSPSPAAVAPTRPPPPTREEFAAEFARLGGSVHALARHFQRDRRQIYRWIDAYGLKQ